MCEVVGISIHRAPWRVIEKSQAEAAVNDADGKTILLTSAATAYRIVAAVNAYPMLLADNHQKRAALDSIASRLRREHSDLPAIDEALVTADMALAADERAIDVVPI